MESALQEAEMARKKGEVPVGCVIVLEKKILCKTHNRVEKDDDPTNHCEILALREALAIIGRRKMYDVSLYVTLEPCPMCFFSMILLRIKELIFGTENPKFGACGSVVDLKRGFNHNLTIREGILKERCQRLLSSFFKNLR